MDQSKLAQVFSGESYLEPAHFTPQQLVKMLVAPFSRITSNTFAYRGLETLAASKKSFPWRDLVEGQYGPFAKHNFPQDLWPNTDFLKPDTRIIPLSAQRDNYYPLILMTNKGVLVLENHKVSSKDSLLRIIESKYVPFPKNSEDAADPLVLEIAEKYPNFLVQTIRRTVEILEEIIEDREKRLDSARWMRFEMEHALDPFKPRTNGAKRLEKD